MTIAHLSIPASPTKREMLELLDNLRAGVETGEIVGLLVTTIGTGLEFASWSVSDASATTRIGYLMCHVDDLVRKMRS
jgi:hypothetical protein